MDTQTDTKKYYRRATVSHAEAVTGLAKSIPNLELISFVKKAAETPEEALNAKAKLGDQIYVATVRVAEFPPSDDEGGESPEEKPKEEKPEGESEESPDDGGEDAAPEFGSDAAGPGAPGEEKPKKLSPEEETNHLLRQILDALKGGADPGLDAGLGGDPLAGGPDLPDVGAPPAGGGLPPHGGKPPLPPPIAPKAPMGAGAFSHVVASEKVFTFRREDSHEVNNGDLIREAMTLAPGFRVAKIDRRTEQGAAHVSMARIEG